MHTYNPSTPEDQTGGSEGHPQLDGKLAACWKPQATRDPASKQNKDKRYWLVGFLLLLLVCFLFFEENILDQNLWYSVLGISHPPLPLDHLITSRRPTSH